MPACASSLPTRRVLAIGSGSSPRPIAAAPVCCFPRSTELLHRPEVTSGPSLSAGEGFGVRHGVRGHADLVLVARARSGGAIGHRELEADIGRGREEHPVVPIDVASSEDLEEHLFVVGREEPEAGRRLAVSRQHVTFAGRAVGSLEAHLGREPPRMEARHGVVRRARQAPEPLEGREARRQADPRVLHTAAGVKAHDLIATPHPDGLLACLKEAEGRGRVLRDDIAERGTTLCKGPDDETISSAVLAHVTEDVDRPVEVAQDIGLEVRDVDLEADRARRDVVAVDGSDLGLVVQGENEVADYLRIAKPECKPGMDAQSPLAIDEIAPLDMETRIDARSDVDDRDGVILDRQEAERAREQGVIAGEHGLCVRHPSRDLEPLHG